MVLEPKFLKFQRRFQKNETTAIVGESEVVKLLWLRYYKIYIP
jgi:hypothetical protein